MGDGITLEEVFRKFPHLRPRPSVSSQLLQDDPIRFEESLRVFVCRLCQRVLMTTISRHIQTCHNRDARYCQQDIKAYAGGFDGFAATAVTNADEIARLRPLPDARPIDGLPVYCDGLLCLLCAAEPSATTRPTPYICISSKVMQHHLRLEHHLSLPRNGARNRTAGAQLLVSSGLVRAGQPCQALVARTKYCRYFAVVAAPRTPEPEPQQQQSTPSPARTPVDAALSSAVRSRVLEAIEQEHSSPTQIALASSPARYTLAPVDGFHFNVGRQSAWVQLTEWHRYLGSHDMIACASLLDMPSASTGQKRRSGPPDCEKDVLLLRCVLGSFDRILQRGRESLANGDLNVFDKHKLNSFFCQRQHHKAIFYNLRENSWARYALCWKRLLCFTYRLVHLRCKPCLHFKMTRYQLDSFEGLIQVATALSEEQEQEQKEEEEEEGREYEVASNDDNWSSDRKASWERLDSCCLDFMISLLDHRIEHDIYDNLLVGFLAVLSIVTNENGKQLPQPRLTDAVHFAPSLSALVKVAQVLVARKAVMSARCGKASFPGEALDAMQDRFMSFEARSPIAWVLKLRRYARAVRESSTTTGFLSWSDDFEVLTYKSAAFSMTQLRELVATQVALLRDDLSRLCFIESDAQDAAAATMPPLDLGRLADNPAVDSGGWYFVKDDKNAPQLRGGKTWLLDRALSLPRVQQRFLHIYHQDSSPAGWRVDGINWYLGLVNQFLERLLLLAHVAGGQPARGTELLSIQFRNSYDGSARRNIFVENGLVSFVTYYHKGYSLTGTTRIIHRYLPRSVSQATVYYIWLVVPFVERLIAAAKPPATRLSSEPFLWGGIISWPLMSPSEDCDSGSCNDPPVAVVQRKRKRTQSRAQKKLKTAERRALRAAGSHEADQPWPSSRLSCLLKREFKAVMQTDMDIHTWRHCAIAISRRHLGQSRFKRDYVEALSMSLQDSAAAHVSRTAGNIYARFLTDAPGEVDSHKVEYRRMCRKWHEFLGLDVGSRGKGAASLTFSLWECSTARPRALRTASSASVPEDAPKGRSKHRGKGSRLGDWPRGLTAKNVASFTSDLDISSDSSDADLLETDTAPALAERQPESGCTAAKSSRDSYGVPQSSYNSDCSDYSDYSDYRAEDVPTLSRVTARSKSPSASSTTRATSRWFLPHSVHRSSPPSICPADTRNGLESNESEDEINVSASRRKRIRRKARQIVIDSEDNGCDSVIMQEEDGPSSEVDSTSYRDSSGARSLGGGQRADYTTRSHVDDDGEDDLDAPSYVRTYDVAEIACQARETRRRARQKGMYHKSSSSIGLMPY